jgi:hypothetical protein
MLVRFEKTSNPLKVLVIDENNKYLGETYLETLHKFCIQNDDILLEDDYEYWTVNKELIRKYCKNEKNRSDNKAINLGI